MRLWCGNECGCAFGVWGVLQLGCAGAALVRERVRLRVRRVGSVRERVRELGLVVAWGVM